MTPETEAAIRRHLRAAAVLRRGMVSLPTHMLLELFDNYEEASSELLLRRAQGVAYEADQPSRTAPSAPEAQACEEAACAKGAS